MFFSDTTGFYLYSSLLQANAAILSILGVFTIFRIQSLQSIINLIQNSLLQPRGAHNPDFNSIDEFDSLSLKQKQEKLTIIEKQSGKWYYSYYGNWLKKEEELDKIKKSIVSPSIWLASSIVVFAFLLILSKWIHCQSTKVETCVFLMIIFFESWILYSVLNYVFKVVGIKTREKKETS